ncbi:glycosyltransferase family 2 protein [Pedobacter sp. JCM 36344]|uniref:glycosyltransferase family 2 protein n=1 Tax=Pedobacter sp. JCM 36344 TaxID=3374280 RepID=UPI00397880A8
MALISIITVNFNQPQATLDLLKSIYECYPKANLEVIVVDNGSKEDLGEEFKNTNLHVLYIRSEKNLGFAGGNNLGIKSAKGEYLFLINNDTEFSSGLLETLTETMDANRSIGIISPKINYFDKKEIIQYAGFTPMNYYTCRNECIGQFETDRGQFNNIVAETGFVHGAAMMIRRSALKAVGNMAENFFLYYEEMDWCEQIKRAGFKIWVNTNALIYHKESMSVGKNSALKEFFMNRNRILFIRRNGTAMQKSFFWVYFICFVTPRNLIKYISEGNSSYISILFKAIFWNITNKTTSKNLGYFIK